MANTQVPPQISQPHCFPGRIASQPCIVYAQLAHLAQPMYEALELRWRTPRQLLHQVTLIEFIEHNFHTLTH